MLRIPIIEDNQGAIVAATIGVSVDVFIHRAAIGVEVVQQKSFTSAKQGGDAEAANLRSWRATSH